MAQYVWWSSAGAYVESDGQARSPVRPEGSVGRLEPANDKPPTYWLSAHGRPSPSSRSTQAAAAASAPRPNPYWPGTVADGRPSEPIVWGSVSPGRPRLGGGAVAEPGRVTLPAALCEERFNEGRGELWLEVLVCNHVTFPERHRQRRQQIASDFSSRCLEMVLMLWIMSVGEQAARNWC